MLGGKHAEISDCRDRGCGVRTYGRQHPGRSGTGAGGEQPPSGVVSATPASGTPHLKSSNDNPVQQIRQLVQCGNTMYAVGSFSQIIKGSTTYTRNNIFSFQATKPYTVTSWAPDVVGTEGNTPHEQRRDQHHRVRQRQLRRRLHRREVHLGQRHHRPEHRRDRHHHRQRGEHLRDQGIRRGADHGRRGQSSPGRRQLHRPERRHRRPVHGQREPHHRQERRVPAPEHLG